MRSFLQRNREKTRRRRVDRLIDDDERRKKSQIDSRSPEGTSRRRRRREEIPAGSIRSCVHRRHLGLFSVVLVCASARCYPVVCVWLCFPAALKLVITFGCVCVCLCKRVWRRKAGLKNRVRRLEDLRNSLRDLLSGI